MCFCTIMCGFVQMTTGTSGDWKWPLALLGPELKMTMCLLRLNSGPLKEQKVL